jgi:hypothetical protein
MTRLTIVIIIALLSMACCEVDHHSSSQSRKLLGWDDTIASAYASAIATGSSSETRKATSTGEKSKGVQLLLVQCDRVVMLHLLHQRDHHRSSPSA